MKSMSSTKNPQAHASDHAAAIARWDDEGGAPRSAPPTNGAGALKKRRHSRRIVDDKQRNRINLAQPKRGASSSAPQGLKGPCPFSRGSGLGRKRRARDRHGRSLRTGQSFHLGTELVRERL